MAKNKPDYIVTALHMLEEMRLSAPEQYAALQHILPVFAATAAKSGENVTKEFLTEHAAQGKQHLQDFIQERKKQPAEKTSPLAQYREIKAGLPKPEADTDIPVEQEIIDARRFDKAVIDGRLDTVMRHFEQQNTPPDNRLLILAAQHGHLDLVKYFVEQGCDIRAENDWTLSTAAARGHLDVVQYCVAQGCDIRAHDNHATKWSAANGHLDVLKYCVAQGGDIRAYNDDALFWALLRGHLDVAKYCVQQGCDIQKTFSKIVFSDALLFENADVLRYCVEQGADLHLDNDRIFRTAVETDCIEIVKYCVEQGCDPDGQALYPKLRENLNDFDRWVKQHGYSPRGLHHFSPHFFKPYVFQDIVEILALENYKGAEAHQYAYHAAGLFSSTKRVLDYLEKWGAVDPLHGAIRTVRQPLHDVIQNIRLPKQGRFNAAAWGDAVLKHGPKMARLVKFADRLPEPLKNADGTWSYLKTREEVAKFAYKKGTQNPALAAICLQYDWGDEDFQDALGHIQKYQKKYAANDNKKPHDRIPDIDIDGAEFDKTGYRFYKLPDGDWRGLFLGEMTNCCQHLAGVGADCASHGFLSKHSGFYVVEDQKKDEIIAQSWAWRGKDNALVLDSLESLGNHFTAAQWQKLAETLAEKIAANAHDITALKIGTGGATPRMDFKKTDTPSTPQKYSGYRDSRQQYQIWRRSR